MAALTAGAAHEMVPEALPCSLHEVAALVLEHYGLSGDFKLLSGEVDLNFRLDGGSGASAVVKLARPDEDAGVVDFQVKALNHLAATPGLPVSRVILSRTGQPFVQVALANGEQRLLRMLSFQPGLPLVHVPLNDALRGSTGRLAAQLARAFAGFSHASEHRHLIWDMTRAADLLPMIEEMPRRQRAMPRMVLERFLSGFMPVIDRFETQVIHNDLNLGNVFVDAARPDSITGCIDFGDMVRAPRIIDLAVAAAYQIDPENPLASLLAMAKGYHAELPLTVAEINWLTDLVLMRAVLTVVITQWRSQKEPWNAPYILRNAPGARAVLETLGSIAPREAREALMDGIMGAGL